MENLPATLWIAACAHQLKQRWHSVDALELEDLARHLRHDARLRAMRPDEAALDWLRPITNAAQSAPAIAPSSRPSPPVRQRPISP